MWEHRNDNAVRGDPRGKNTLQNVPAETSEGDLFLSDVAAVLVIFEPIENPPPGVDGSLCLSAFFGANSIAIVDYTMAESASCEHSLP
jgi:hypothetical protein